MSDDQFMRLFKYIEDFRTEVNTRFETVATKDSVERLAASVDALIGHYETVQTEQAARDAHGSDYLNGLVKYRKRRAYRLKTCS